MEKAMLMESTDNPMLPSMEEVRQQSWTRIRFLVSLISLSKELNCIAEKMNKSKISYIFSFRSTRATVDVKMNEFRWILAKIEEKQMRSDDKICGHVVEVVNNFQKLAKVEPKVKDLLKEL